MYRVRQTMKMLFNSAYLCDSPCWHAIKDTVTMPSKILPAVTMHPIRVNVTLLHYKKQLRECFYTEGCYGNVSLQSCCYSRMHHHRVSVTMLLYRNKLLECFVTEINC